MLSVLISIIGILLTILFVVGVHELGHFLVARAVGVKVLRFSIGFGKALYRWYDKKGTEYVLAAIPLGGYIKMLDETEGTVAPEELHLAYNRQSIYKKMLIVFAGPFANLLFALVLYWIIFTIGFTTLIPLIGNVAPHSIAATAGLKPQQEILSINGKPTPSWAAIAIRLLPYTGNKEQLLIETRDLNTSEKKSYLLDLTNWRLNDLEPDLLGSLGIVPYEPRVPAIIGHIQENSPAAKAHLKTGDKIISIDKHIIYDWMQVLHLIATHPEKTLSFVISRDGKTLTIPVTMTYKRDLLFNKYGYLGIGPQFQWPKELLRKNQYGPLAALNRAWQDTVDFTFLNFLLLGKLFTGKISLQSLGGPITIFETAGGALNIGILPFLSFLAFLSISIGFINILPIPGLDGGHLLFQFIELIMRRPLSLRVQTLLYRAGLIILLLLVAQAITNDLLRL